MVGDQPCGEQSNALARQNGVADGVAVVKRELAGDRFCHGRALSIQKPPRQTLAAASEDDAATPDMAAEAMRAYAEETNRLNRTRRLSADNNRHDLAETEKAICEIVRIIETGGWHRALSERLTELEAKQDDLTARLSQAPVDVPDLHPGIAETYRRRIGRLTEALAHPDDAVEAADALREVIDRIVLTPGDKRGQLHITLQGEFGTILDWIERTGKPGYRPDPDTATSRLSVSVKTRAGFGVALSPMSPSVG
jgi:site-specific DNA recombinase